MRILHLLNAVRDSGNGIVHVAVDLACLQARKGHTVLVASAGGEFESLLAEYGVAHQHLEQRARASTLVRIAGEYRRLVTAFDPDIVHAHMITGAAVARLLRFRHRYALVATVHNEFRRDAVLMGVADCVIAVSGAVARALRKRGIPERKLAIVKNGPLESPRSAEVTRIEAKPLFHPAITTVAGMYERKGIRELIEAFALVTAEQPAAHLYLVGDGPDRLAFERQAAASPASAHIHFERFQKHPQRYLLSTDVFVLASRREPFGLVLAEAREAGCAIVATAVDGIPEALENGAAGRLVPPRQPQALAAAINALVSDRTELQAWRERARTNLGWLSAHRVVDETLAVYRSLCVKKGRCGEAVAGRAAPESR